jgi:hypothetical protein
VFKSAFLFVAVTANSIHMQPTNMSTSMYLSAQLWCLSSTGQHLQLSLREHYPYHYDWIDSKINLYVQ